MEVEVSKIKVGLKHQDMHLTCLSKINVAYEILCIYNFYL